ncbi:MAG TPA: hypothetical protein VHB77_02060 [Planctomycetaceae bacterium]|nr:hypothetical protein [Planctomycetaceae bacterium]
MMQRADFLRLIGAKAGAADYIPVACLLRNGHACAGYFNSQLNDDFADTCVLVNSRLVDFQGARATQTRTAIHDFNEFLEQVTIGAYAADSEDADLFGEHDERLGKSIPLTAIDYGEIAVVYPISQIGVLMRRVEQDDNLQTASEVPSFLDFDRKSVILQVLRTRLW